MALILVTLLLCYYRLLDFQTKMITPWRYALVSAEFKKKALLIYLAFKLVTINVGFFPHYGWPYLAFYPH